MSVTGMAEHELGEQLHLLSGNNRCILFIWVGQMGVVRIWSKQKNTWGQPEKWRHYLADYPGIDIDQMHTPSKSCVVDTGDWNG